ncbi:GNAT family N-acetyltransferase [Methanocrinis sp.]|uniref:GNAT family N-acetyltransferase n=1 Tax=Methanocrinis sp. TaxID=3101522 RepID=UPI003D13650D
MKIRRAEARDLPSILAIEELCFSREVAFPPDALSILLEDATALVAEDGNLAGFVIGFVRGEAGKVVTLDVLPERRGEGLGRGLMVALEEEFAILGARASRLEVSIENRRAIALYADLGYSGAALLEDYYGPGEDALLMVKRLRRAGP